MAGAEKRVLEEEAYGEAFAWATAKINRRLQALMRSDDSLPPFLGALQEHAHRSPHP